jgi:nucleotide-binding universal stress UspA family protein
MKTLRILVPLDETPTSVKALDSAGGLVSTDLCSMELLHTIDETKMTAARREASLKQAESFLSRQAQKVASPHVQVSCRVAWGDPAEVILERIRETHFDFICMTTRAIPNNTGEPGSVAARLFRESSVPIIALPAHSASTEEADPHPDRALYRAPVCVPATLEISELKHPLSVVIRDLSAKGAEIESDFQHTFRARDGLLSVTLPTRPEELEIAVAILAIEHRTGDTGQAIQLVHVTFPTIGLADQDAIVGFLNQMRVFEQQQRRVHAPVRIEVITGRRANATFKGRTAVVRPDYVWLHMGGFDHIETADVALTVFSADRRDFVEIDGTVTNVKTSGAEFDVEIEIADISVASARHEHSGDRLMAFIRQYYRDEDSGPEVGTGEAPLLIPRFLRSREAQPPVVRLLTAEPHEAQVPTRAAKSLPDVPMVRRARNAETRALNSMLRPPRKAPPLRSM